MATFPIAGPSNEGSVPKVLTIFDVSSEFLGQLKTWLEQNPPSIPITQIIGFTGFTAQFASVNTPISATSHTYTSLGGPILTGLGDGKYVILYGCGEASLSTGSSPDFAAVSVAVNGTATDNDIATVTTASSIAISRATVATLANAGSNTVELVYRVAVNSPTNVGSFAFSWLIALKISN